MKKNWYLAALVIEAVGWGAKKSSHAMEEHKATEKKMRRRERRRQ